MGPSRDLAAGESVQEKNSSAPIGARSISRPIWESVQRVPREGTVLAVFQHACLLTFPVRKVVALVLPKIGNGPHNIVLENLDPSLRWVQSGVFSATEPGMRAILSRKGLRIGEMEVTLGGAEPWEPRPNWKRVRQNRRGIENRLPLLRTFAATHYPEGSLFSSAASDPCVTVLGQGSARKARAVVQESLQHLQAGWAGDLNELRCGAAQLAGLGGGLTPAGDDFLAGVMLWAWLSHPVPQHFCQCLLESSAMHTTMLSAAFLRSAAEGECSAAWHDLLTALDGGMEHQLARAVTEVLSFGHTSGADALAGFMWMGLTSLQVRIAQRAGDLWRSSPTR